MINFIDDNILNYSISKSEKESKLLNDLYRETYLKVLNPRMISGHYQGRILSLISKIISPKKILEIGTYTGYSAICLCEGMDKDGTLHTIDNNKELVEIQNKYFKKANLKDTWHCQLTVHKYFTGFRPLQVINETNGDCVATDNIAVVW